MEFCRVTRKVIIDICKDNNIPILEETISKVKLLLAKEVFFTNRLIEIHPVIKVNSQLINGGEVGEMVLLLQKLYKNKILLREV
jgi:D-alanine transaminase